MSIIEKIEELEREIRETPYNKATQHHIGKLKAKIARLKEAKSRKTNGKGFAIKKSGDATVGIVGFPSVGKSTLLNRLTEVESEIADYDFTTTTVIPGMMEYKGSRIQILDLPGIIEGASFGKGRGKEILSIIRNMDLLLLMVENRKSKKLKIMERELWNARIRLNRSRPNVIIKKKDRGGINVITPLDLNLDPKTIGDIARKNGIVNADIIIRENLSRERFIDALSNRVYLPAILVVNKIDRSYPFKKYENWEALPISAKKGIGIDGLRKKIFGKLDFIRVYMKISNEKEPLIVKNGSTIGEICSIIHSDLAKNFRYARICGPSAKFRGQRAGMDHKLKDGDVVTIVA